MLEPDDPDDLQALPRYLANGNSRLESSATSLLRSSLRRSMETTLDLEGLWWEFRKHVVRHQHGLFVDELTAEIREELSSAIREQEYDSLKKKVMSQIRTEVEPALRAQIESELRASLMADQDFIADVRAQLKRQLLDL